MIVTASIILAAGILLFVLVRHFQKESNRQKHADGQDSADQGKTLFRDQHIQKLTVQINKLAALNNRYLTFMLKVPAIVQRLHSTMKLDGIVLSIIDMVNDVLTTDKVEIYLFDDSANLLRKYSANGSTQQEETSCALGEGIIGAAAKHRFLMVTEHFSRNHPSLTPGKEQQLSMAMPILFKDSLLGVIGIGRIESPSGNEGDLLRMIADIAGVALINQTALNEAQHKANTDPLTGLNNRNYLFKMAQHYIEKSVRERTVLSVFLFDIDNFKHYNDTNGHGAGDQLLRELSQLIRDATRRQSIIARYGGEEFIVMLPEISREDALQYAERLRETIAHHDFAYRAKQPLGFVSISGGVACFPQDGDTIHKVIEHADIALYRAKSMGRNRILLYEPASPEEKAIGTFMKAGPSFPSKK
ncbi:MAG: sensor domain-containing diguanylate cyclase [Nitrospirota bacterium]